MKAITIWQPWASLIACGTRPVSYRIKPGGSTKLVTPAGDVISCETVDDPAEAQGWGYAPHWSTCNAPDSFRKR